MPRLSTFICVVVNVFVDKLVMYLLLFRSLSIVLLMDLLLCFCGGPVSYPGSVPYPLCVATIVFNKFLIR